MTSNSLSSLFRIELDKFNSRSCILATHLLEFVKQTPPELLDGVISPFIAPFGVALEVEA